jgi:undecaprenyl-diphosphatase
MIGEKTYSFFRSPPGKFSIHLTWGILAGVSLLLLFAKIVEDLLYHELGTFDTVVTQYIQSFATNELTKVAILITQIGSPRFDIIVMVISGSYLLFRLKHTWETLVLAISLAGGGLLNYALKNIFHRTRPDIQHLVNAGGYSFPSGHAMISATFYGMLGYLIWLNLHERNNPSWFVIVVTAILITAIGVSRIYLGVHFPSDVVAGFAAGGIWLIACILGLQAIRCYKN